MLRQVQGGIWGLPQVHHHHSQAAGRPSSSIKLFGAGGHCGGNCGGNCGSRCVGHRDGQREEVSGVPFDCNRGQDFVLNRYRK